MAKLVVDQEQEFMLAEKMSTLLVIATLVFVVHGARSLVETTIPHQIIVNQG